MNRPGFKFAGKLARNDSIVTQAYEQSIKKFIQGRVLEHDLRKQNVESNHTLNPMDVPLHFMSQMGPRAIHDFSQGVFSAYVNNDMRTDH